MGYGKQGQGHFHLNSLNHLSVSLASDPLLVQGAGGNTSLKDGNLFWIKASGKWLARAEQEEIFVGIDWFGVLQWLETDQENISVEYVKHNSSLHPSIETSLHALMPHRVVAHTHPVDLIALAVRNNGLALFQDVLSGFSWAWVPYSRPGRDLAASLRRTLQTKNPDVLILESHGLVVGADSEAEALALTQEVVAKCKQVPRPVGALRERVALEELTDAKLFRFPAHDIIHTLVLDPISFSYFNRPANVLYPDQAVFLGERACLRGDKGRASTRGTFKPPPYVIVPNAGVLLAADADPMVEQMLCCHAEVLLRIPEGTDLKYLSSEEVGMILGWEPEKYRQALANGAP